MPTLKLTAGKPASTRTAPARKSPARKPAAKAAAKAPARKRAAAAAPAETNGAATRGPRLPDGWTQRDFDKLVKDMEQTVAYKNEAQEALAEAQAAVNELALSAIAEGIQMSVVSETLSLSRQWLYKLMDENGVTTARQATKPHPNKGLTQEQIEAKAARDAAKPKRAAKKPAAKVAPARKAAPAAKRKPAAKAAPARRTPARGRVRIAA